MITEMDAEYEAILKRSPLLSEFDFEDSAQFDAIVGRLTVNQNKPEYWVYISRVFLSLAKNAVEERNAQEAAWAMAGPERFRSLYIFKENFEEVVWMGHSAKRLTQLLSLWDTNKTNADEEFWQIQFQAHSFAFSQLFSVPVTFIERKAYVGGQGLTGPMPGLWTSYFRAEVPAKRSS